MSWSSFLTSAAGNLVTLAGRIGETLDNLTSNNAPEPITPPRGPGERENINRDRTIGLFETERVINTGILGRITNTFLGASQLVTGFINNSPPSDAEALEDLIHWETPMNATIASRFVYQNTSSLREILEAIRQPIINNRSQEYWSIQINGIIRILDPERVARYIDLLDFSQSRDLDELLARNDINASDHQLMTEDRRSQNRFIVSKTFRMNPLRASGGRVDKVIRPDHDLESHHLSVLSWMQFYTAEDKCVEDMSRMCLRNAIEFYVEAVFKDEDTISRNLIDAEVWIDPEFNHNHKIATRHLGAIAKELGCPIVLRKFKANGIHVRESGNFGKDLPGRRIEIALYKDHYIPYLPLLDSSRFFGCGNTLQFFRYIEEHDYLIGLDFEEQAELYGEVKFCGILDEYDMDEGFQDPIKYKQKKLFSKKKFAVDPLVVELDTETDTISGDYHQVHTVCVVIASLNIEEGFIGKYSMRKALNLIVTNVQKVEEGWGKGLNPQPVVVYAHNLRYDIAEITPLVGAFGYLGSCSDTKQMTGIYLNTKFVFKDSRAFIGNRLADFTKMFKLLKMDEKFVHDQDPRLLERLEQLGMSIEEYANNNKLSKEICPYALYSYKKNIHLPFVDLEEALDVIKAQGSNVEEFIKAANAAECITDDKFFHMKYSIFYCLRDCQILSAGFKVFRNGCMEQLGLDPINYPTISSMTFAYFHKEGVMDGVCKATGKVRAFLQDCARGGRTMTNNNKKYIVSSRLAYIDAVSLYPSAMKELGGLLKGKGKLLSAEDIETERYWNYDGFFVEIDIINVWNKRDFPWLRREDKTSKEYTNDFRGIMKVSKIGLELLIKAHDIEYKVIQGIYFNEGRNNRLGVVIQSIFDNRRILQIENNSLEITWKLLMNAFYGKLLMRSFPESIRIYNNPMSLHRYLSKNSDRVNWIVDSSNIRGGNFCATVSTFVPKPKHSNYVHCGVEILDMSKVIMDRPMQIAEENKMTMLYTDTDSVQILEAKLPSLERLFREKYKTDMMGNDLGQFHPDFKPPGAYDKSVEPVSTLGIFTEKKVYYNEVEYKTLDGKIEKYDHFRYRGVSKATLLGYENIKKLYLTLTKGVEEIVFDLNSNGQPRFKMNRNMLVSNHVLSRTGFFPGPVTYINDKRWLTINIVKDN